MYKNTNTKFIDVLGVKFAYRELGQNEGVPVIFLNHLTAVLDNWDPRVIDGLAKTRHVIAFDNRGVGASEGVVPLTVSEMAKDAVAFIRALGYDTVDLLGFSLGGFIAQEILLTEPNLVRKAILAGTGPAGGLGIDKVTKVTVLDILKGYATFKDPKYYLFFTGSKKGRSEAREFLKRLGERTENRDKGIALTGIARQLKAIHSWGVQEAQDLSAVKQPVLVVNGNSDKMVPSVNSIDLSKRLPHSELVLYEDAGHGGIFQYHDNFANKALEFLNK